MYMLSLHINFSNSTRSHRTTKEKTSEACLPGFIGFLWVGDIANDINSYPNKSLAY